MHLARRVNEYVDLAAHADMLATPDLSLAKASIFWDPKAVHQE
jgi:hypothetical protein